MPLKPPPTTTVCGVMASGCPAASRSALFIGGFFRQRLYAIELFWQRRIVNDLCPRELGLRVVDSLVCNQPAGLTVDERLGSVPRGESECLGVQRASRKRAVLV